MDRILITGASGTGKSYLASTLESTLSLPLYACDDLIRTHSWSEASEYIASNWLTLDGPLLIEGCSLPRALRKYLQSLPTKPADKLIVLTKPWREQSPGQIAQGKGLHTVLNEILPELGRRGTVVEYL